MSKALAVCHGSFGRVTVYELNRNLATHVHREGHLVFFLKGARPSMSIDERKVPIGPGQAAAINPWEPHAWEVCPSGDDTLLLTVYVDPNWFQQVSVNWDGAFEFGRADLQVTLDIHREVQAITSLLLDERDVTDRSASISSALYSLTRRCFEQSWHGTDTVRRAGDRAELSCSDSRVKKALVLMRTESSADVSLDRIARESGLSRPHFFKLFKEQTGITPNLFLNNLRMERALDRLTDTDLSVTEIAYELGFSSQASFTRFFCTNVGIPPSDYRRVATGDAGTVH